LKDFEDCLKNMCPASKVGLSGPSDKPLGLTSAATDYQASGAAGEGGLDFRQPVVAGLGVGAEGFGDTLAVEVEQGAVEAEVAGVRGVNEAGGIAGAHLEEDAHFKFAEGLAAEAAVDVVIRVHAGEQVETAGGAFVMRSRRTWAGLGAEPASPPP